MNKILTEKAPAAIGPYSQAVETTHTVYVSGQLPLDPATGEFPAVDIQAQTRMSLDNISAILAKAGLGMDRVVKTTVLLQNMTDFAAMNEVYNKYFAEPYPARVAFAVAALPRGARVEIEAVAEK